MLDGQNIKLNSARQAVANGIFLIPEDRKLNGILLDLPIAQNISLPNLPAYARRSMVSPVLEDAAAETQRRQLSIKAPSISTRTGTLSGGNQQKALLARWLMTNPRILILDEPTRGIDVGAKADHRDQPRHTQQQPHQHHHQFPLAAAVSVAFCRRRAKARFPD